MRAADRNPTISKKRLVINKETDKTPLSLRFMIIALIIEVKNARKLRPAAIGVTIKILANLSLTVPFMLQLSLLWDKDETSYDTDAFEQPSSFEQ